MLLQLFDPSPDPNTHSLGYVRDCVLTIRFNDQPAGACDRNYNPEASNVSDPPFNQIPGANSSVKAVAVQPADDKTIIGGNFTAYNTHVQNHVTRINTDGSIDTGFTNSIGTAADNSVETIDVDSAGNILLGGAFTSFNGTPRKAIARLHPDGTLDNSFDPGLGANNTIFTILSQSAGTVMIGGQFTSYNGTNRNYVARLNNNGTIDPSFDPGQGPDAKVLSLDVQSDGKVVIVGEFNNVSGVARSHLARLNTDGSLDTSFDPGTGADDIVRAVKIQPDGRILIVGDFNSVRNANRKGICRLNPDGTIDTTFNPGTGSDDIIQCVKLQTDGTILIGGPFKQYNQTRRIGFARLLANGSVDTTFLDVAYNQYAGVPNTFWDPTVDPPNFVASCGIQSDGRIMIGGSFLAVGGGNSRDAISTRYNVARLIGGGTPGPGNVLLTSDTYTADENGQTAFVTMVRTNGTLGPAVVDFAPQAKDPGPGSAVPDVDYSWDPKNSFLNNATPTWPSSYDVAPQDTWQVQDGSFGPNQNNALTVDPGLTLITFNDKTFITIIDNTNIDGNRDFLVELAHPRGFDQLFLGTAGGAVDANGFTLGENIPTGLALGRAQATMTIVDNDSLAGVLSFAVDNFTVGEATKFATVTVIRTNGSAGQVQVNYTTSDGTNSNPAFNAVAPGDYLPKSGVLTFNAGVTQATFQVQIINDATAEEDEQINLILTSPNNGARLGRGFATLTIVDNDNPNGRLDFASANFTTNENAGAATITVNRNGASAGTLVAYYVVYDTNVPSLNGTNYIAVTNSLTWNNNDVVPKTFTIPLLDNTIVDGNHTINLALVAATVNGVTNSALIGAQSNSVLTIVDDDAYGTLGFTRPYYNVMENGGPATITVHRSLGIAQTLTVNFATIPGSASAGFDYSATNGVLNFAPGEVAKSFTVPIIDHPASQIDASNRTVILQLFSPTPNSSVLDPLLAQATLNIVDDETFNEPAGLTDTALNFNLGFDGDVYALGLQTNGMIVAAGDFLHANSIARSRIARLNPDGSLDTSFSSTTAGVSSSVRALLVQSDGRIVIGGVFTNVNGNVINRIARLDYTGNLNNTFNPGGGADNSVFALAETFTSGGARKILVGGAFINLAGSPRSRIGRLNDDGSADGNFDPGIGADGTVYAIAVYPTNSVRSGQVLIGGDFTAVNGQGRNHIARLNADGSLDLSFNPPSGANDSVRTIAIQTDERILIGGLFTNVNGSAFNRIARLLPSGATDSSFTPAAGGNEIVTAIALQPDNKIVLGGQFTVFSGVTRNRITRLNSDGSADPTINFGLGADSFVSALLVQPDDRIVLGGGFTHFDGLTAAHITRIYGRNLNGSGTFEFDAANYVVNENGTNVVVTIRRRDGTSGFPTGNVFVTMSTSNGTAVAGINFSNVATTIAFPPGEVFENVSIPIINDFVVNADRYFTNYLSNPQPSGGPALGNQASSTVRIINDDSSVSFKSATYSINEDISSGVANIEIVRAGSILGSSAVNFSTAFGGTAVAGVNYNPTNFIVSFGPGQTNAFVQVPILHDPSPSGDKTVSLVLSNASGSILLAPSQATLTIIDVENAPGQFVFSAPAYFVGEGDGVAPITIIRTNGHSGIVTVHFDTFNGTAIAGQHYFATNNTLTFGDGQTVKSFNVRIIDDNLVQGPRALTIALSNPTGGATLGSPTNVPLTIFDNDVGVSLSSAIYSVGEGGGALTIPVQRLNGSNGVVSVQFATTNGTATAPSDYIATSGTLTFNPGETLKTFTVPIVQDSIVEGDETFTVRLFGLISTNGAQLVTSSATVTILDDDPAVFFATNSYSVAEGGTNVILTIIRTNAALAGTNVITFFTTDGSATASSGDYTATSGTLTFANGESSKTIAIPIIQDTQVEGDEFFTVTLGTNSQSGGVQIFDPSVATVTIVDDDAGIKFSSPTYSVSESGVSATITVLRTAVTNSLVTVDFATQNGTATAGSDYFATNGTLTFLPGEVSKTFKVGVIDDTLIEGDETVLLSLSNPTGQGSLLAPNAAVLTIVDNDGSLILAAGSALTADPNGNGVIDPGETVTLLLALRNSKGAPTTNLVATLQANSSVTPITTSQSYGVLVQDGPSVSRPFTFTANGTNGGTVTVTLQLTDGSSTNGFPSTATFTYALGTSSARFTNSGSITINDNTTASPYPSVINVAGINGAVTKASVTISNYSHSHSADVDVLLSSPAGANVVLMANAGSAGVSRANLTFDDDAATFLPSGSGIVTGTNKPTAYPAVPPFPAPAPAGPYSTAMSAFNNSNPNGDWSLYVQDDTSVNTGGITNGWILSLTTANLVLPSADIKVTVSDLPDPVIVGSNLTYSITISNFGPASASGVTLTSILPPNLTNISASIGGYTLGGTAITFTNLGTLAKDARLSFTISGNPSSAGTVSNMTSVAANENDPFAGDNGATNFTAVLAPSADLALSLAGSPDPVTVGGNITYSMSVSNAGLATATSVRLTNTLPAGVTIVSTSPGATTNGNVITFDLGNLGNGAVANCSIVVRADVMGQITDSASVGSTILDPLKVNNSASIKTIVQPVLLSISRSGATVTISWPASALGYVLEGSSSLSPQAWSQITVPPPTVIGDQKVVTLGASNSARYFRLHSP